MLKRIKYWLQGKECWHISWVVRDRNGGDAIHGDGQFVISPPLCSRHDLIHVRQGLADKTIELVGKDLETDVFVKADNVQIVSMAKLKM